MTKIYRDYTQEELDWQYDQGSLVSNIPEYMDRCRDATTAAKAAVKCVEDVAYGGQEHELLDIYVPGDLTSPAPIRIFFHGGAWMGGDKAVSGGAAAAFVAHGAIYVAVDFSLAPAASLDQIVDQVRRAVWYVYEHATDYGGDPERIYLAGHSSGGHLAAMVAVTDWATQFSGPADLVKGLMASSGPYDTEPCRLSARNDYLHLDEAAAARTSVANFVRPGLPPAIFACGGGELPEFQRQSRDLAAQWRTGGMAVEEIHLPDHNHFDMNAEYNTTGSDFQNAVLGQMGLI